MNLLLHISLRRSAIAIVSRRVDCSTTTRFVRKMSTTAQDANSGRLPLNAFLAQAKKDLSSSQIDGALRTLVVGNESADLDSICSAILLAYLKSHSSASSSSHQRNVYIPLCNIEREELRLRRELIPVCQRAGFEVEDFITLSEVWESELVKEKDGRRERGEENTQWVLVDHNAMTGELGRIFGDRVRGVVDHHVDEGLYVAECEEGRVLKTVGSCASLVVESMRSSWPADLDKNIAYVALAPIFIDTNVLQSKDKTTNVDRDAVAFLEDFLSQYGVVEFDRKAYYEELRKANEDLDALSIQDILKKDYKEWEEGELRLGMSTVVKPLSYLIKKSGSQSALLEETSSYIKDKRLDLYAIMTLSHGEEVFRRELMLEAGPRGREAAERFQKEESESLKLGEWQRDGSVETMDEGGDGEVWRKVWAQDDTSKSRKQVAPMLRGAMGRK